MGRTANKHIQAGIQQYVRQVGLPPVIESHYAQVDEERARLIAAEYESLLPISADALPAYTALAIEIQQQWDFAQDVLGIRFDPWLLPGQPYQNSQDMCEDVAANKHLWFFTGGEVHPYLGVTDEQGLSYNDKFRAVHDLFGHSAEGYQFGPRGEENAWLHHSQMFSALAQKALTTETRGQNSWVNFGPYASLPVTERPFAEQKAALLPDWCCDWRSILQ